MRTVLLFALPIALIAQANDWKIVPGERVGPITRESTLASLKQAFGANNVREETIPGAEGDESPGAIVFPDDPARRLAIVWGEGVSAAHPAYLQICYRQEPGGTCRWKTAEGITLGTSLIQLERLNGHHFHLAGFGWDDGGVVLSWDGGQLEKLRAGGVGLMLNPDVATFTTPIYNQVSGDHTFSSGHPAMRTLDPRVISIICRLAK